MTTRVRLSPEGSRSMRALTLPREVMVGSLASLFGKVPGLLAESDSRDKMRLTGGGYGHTAWLTHRGIRYGVTFVMQVRPDGETFEVHRVALQTFLRP